MKEGRASWTAIAVAVARGIGTPYQQPDPTAIQLLPGVLGEGLRHWQSLPPWIRRGAIGLRACSGGMLDHIALRTRAIDRALEREAARGIEQLVVLGAGFDGRAYRLRSLANIDVFEVDHPATAVAKRARAGDLLSHANAVTHVTVDFSRESVDRRLLEAGLDPTRPTFWLWEGVTPYLPLEAIESSLVAIAKVSGPRSVIAMTYALPHLMTVAPNAVETLVRRAFNSIGEPLLGAMSQDEARERMQLHGFEVLSDTGQRDWAGPNRLAAGLGRPFRAERLMLARRSRSHLL